MSAVRRVLTRPVTSPTVNFVKSGALEMSLLAKHRLETHTGGGPQVGEVVG